VATLSMAFAITLLLQRACRVDRRARRVRTDRIDTERLRGSLLAYLRGGSKVGSVVRVPGVAEEHGGGGCTASGTA
jgi:hypothetical protein